MSAISAAQHSAFIGTVKKELAATGETNWLDEYLEKYLCELEELHAGYTRHLDAIHQLMREYEALKKQTRIMLRRRLAAHKRQSVKKARALGQAISKAS